MFTRGWSTKTARGPAGDRGLGLALVAQAVARCGGTVTRRARSRERGSWSGSCRTGASRGRVRSARRSIRDGSRRGGPMIQVLVVEDEPIAARAHRAYVERVAGFAVAAVAHSRMEAERALGQGGVDLVLLDLHLPDGQRPGPVPADPGRRVDGRRDGGVLRPGCRRGAIGRRPGCCAVRDQAVRVRRAAGSVAGLPGVPRSGRPATTTSTRRPSTGRWACCGRPPPARCPRA